MTRPGWPVARQVAFFAPADARGKWHAAWAGGAPTPVCGANVALGADAIRTAVGQDSARVHPLVCRRCLRLSTPAGVSAVGMVR